MLAQATVIGFIPCRSLEAAEQFYARTLGLPVQTNDGFALVLRAPGGVTIRCVQAPPFTPQPVTIFGWEVPDIAAASSDLQAAGITPLRYAHFEQDERGTWTAPNGDRILWFADPFGNVLSLSQHIERR